MITSNFRHAVTALGISIAALSLGCARANMQETAAHVAHAVDDLHADVETQQLIRTEIARTAIDRVARGEAELATREASRAADRPQLSDAAEPLLDHSAAVAEGSDPRFAATIAIEVERREARVTYTRQADALESISALLERLAEGSMREDIELYLTIGAGAAEAAHAEWTTAHE